MFFTFYHNKAVIATKDGCKFQFIGLFQVLPYEWDCPINSN